jgi:hypothetical protein
MVKISLAAAIILQSTRSLVPIKLPLIFIDSEAADDAACAKVEPE